MAIKYDKVDNVYIWDETLSGTHSRGCFHRLVQSNVIYASNRSKSVSHIHILHVDSRVNKSAPVHWINNLNDFCGQELTCYVVMLLSLVSHYTPNAVLNITAFIWIIQNLFKDILI